MLRKAICTVVLSLLLPLSAAVADTLIIESIEARDAAGYPGSGQTKASVSKQWGEPTGQSGPVGEPPISSWEYDSFVVFFEYDRVLHTVAKR